MIKVTYFAGTSVEYRHRLIGERHDQISLHEQLTIEAKIELTEQELSRATGGGKTREKPREFIKITMSDIIVSNY